MKKIVCELCEGTQFTKEGGFFVCHGCGTKYSLEEAKSMMREVEGEPEPFVGTPVVAAPVVNPNQQQVDNLLLLATNAFSASNNEDTENYCNRAIELDATCYKAWFLKGKATGWSSKLDNNRMEEAAHSFCQAIDFAPEEEKEDLKTQAVEELKRLGLACISLRKQNFGNNPSKENLNGFNNDKVVLLSALTVLLQHGNVVGMPEGYLEQVAQEMNYGAVAALNFIRKAWGSVEHPGEKDFDTYLGWLGNTAELLRQAINTSDEDDEEDIVRYKNLKIVLDEPMNAHSYKQEWNSYYSRYDWVIEYSLADSAKSSRRKEMAECDAKIAELEKKVREKKDAEKRKAAEEKAARIKAYWEAHADEKASLEAEKDQLEKKTEELRREIGKTTVEIEGYDSEEKAKVPSEAETDELKDQIRVLEKRRANLGMFSGKEKKQITDEIATLQGRVDSLKDKIQNEKQSRTEEIRKKREPLQKKKNEFVAQLETANKRISAIEEEFAKDPG